MGGRSERKRPTKGRTMVVKRQSRGSLASPAIVERKWLLKTDGRTDWYLHPPLTLHLPPGQPSAAR